MFTEKQVKRHCDIHIHQILLLSHSSIISTSASKQVRSDSTPWLFLFPDSLRWANQQGPVWNSVELGQLRTISFKTNKQKKVRKNSQLKTTWQHRKQQIEWDVYLFSFCLFFFSLHLSFDLLSYKLGNGMPVMIRFPWIEISLFFKLSHKYIQ